MQSNTYFSFHKINAWTLTYIQTCLANILNRVKLDKLPILNPYFSSLLSPEFQNLFFVFTQGSSKRERLTNKTKERKTTQKF